MARTGTCCGMRSRPSWRLRRRWRLSRKPRNQYFPRRRGSQRFAPPALRSCLASMALKAPSDGLRFHFLANSNWMRHGFMQRLGVEFALPPAHDDGGDTVADQVGQRAAFAHKLVDAE